MQTKVMIALFGLFAEVERDLISERTKEGLAAARVKGRLTRPAQGFIGEVQARRQGGGDPACSWRRRSPRRRSPRSWASLGPRFCTSSGPESSTREPPEVAPSPAALRTYVYTRCSSFFRLTTRGCCAYPRRLDPSRQGSVQGAPIDAGSCAVWHGRRPTPGGRRVCSDAVVPEAYQTTPGSR